MPENRQEKEKNDLTGPLISNRWPIDLGGLWATTPDLGLSRGWRGDFTFQPGGDFTFENQPALTAASPKNANKSGSKRLVLCHWSATEEVPRGRTSRIQNVRVALGGSENWKPGRDQASHCL